MVSCHEKTTLWHAKGPETKLATPQNFHTWRMVKQSVGIAEGRRETHWWKQVLTTVTPKRILHGRDHVLAGKPGHSVSRCSLQSRITEPVAFQPIREAPCDLRFTHWAPQWTSRFCLGLLHCVSETGSCYQEQAGSPTPNPLVSASWALGLVLRHYNFTCHSSLKSMAQGHEWCNVPNNRLYVDLKPRARSWSTDKHRL